MSMEHHFSYPHLVRMSSLSVSPFYGSSPFSYHEQRVMGACQDNIRQWNLTTGELLAVYGTRHEVVKSLAISDDGLWLAAQWDTF